MNSLPPPDDVPRLTGLQAYTRAVGAILVAATEQFSPRELEAFHAILIEMVAHHVQARDRREAA